MPAPPIPAAATDEKRAAVEAGMDVLGWSYEPAFWHAWSRLRRTQAGFKKPSPTFSGQVGLASLAGTAAGVIATTSVIAEIGICLVGLSTAALALGAWRLLPRQGHKARAEAPPSVLITSTGLLFGDTAWLWHSDREMLAHAGIGHGTPAYLCFRFRRRRLLLGRFDYEIDVPLPPAIAEQAEELTREILRYKVDHTGE